MTKKDFLKQLEGISEDCNLEFFLGLHEAFSSSELKLLRIKTIPYANITTICFINNEED